MICLKAVICSCANAQENLARFAPINRFGALRPVAVLSTSRCPASLIVLLTANHTSPVNWPRHRVHAAGAAPAVVSRNRPHPFSAAADDDAGGRPGDRVTV